MYREWELPLKRSASKALKVVVVLLTSSRKGALESWSSCEDGVSGANHPEMRVYF